MVEVGVRFDSRGIECGIAGPVTSVNWTRSVHFGNANLFIGICLLVGRRVKQVLPVRLTS